MKLGQIFWRYCGALVRYGRRHRWICIGIAFVCLCQVLFSIHSVDLEIARHLYWRINWNNTVHSATEKETDVNPSYDYLAKRRKRIQDICDKKRTKIHTKKHRKKTPALWQDMNFLKLDQRNIMFCKVAKVASTFWSRILHIESINSSLSNPFHVKLEDLTEEHLRGYISLEKSKNFLWARDPYTRLFATYVDKLFAPNPFYWSAIGLPAIRKFRPGYPKDSRHCGQDLTFDEYIKFAIWTEESKHNRDMHSIPISEQCHVCELPYSYIGKMETFNNDVLYILRAVNLTKYLTFIDHMKNDYENDAIYDTLQSPFSWRKDIVKCMTFNDALKRTWRKLQIRGLLSKNTRFPLSEKQSNTIGLDNLLKIIHEIRSRYTDEDNKERKTNRQESYIQAYRLVDEHALTWLRKVYANDFEFFDYNQFPEAIYNRTKKLGNIRFLNLSTV